jgi:hypothetical protein
LDDGATVRLAASNEASSALEYWLGGLHSRNGNAQGRELCALARTYIWLAVMASDTALPSWRASPFKALCLQDREFNVIQP